MGVSVRQIVGIEDYGLTKTLPASQHFLQHLDALRERIPKLRNTTFVVAPECNLGVQATELAHSIMAHRDATPMHRDRIVILDEGGSQYGIRTDDRRNIVTSKENMQLTAKAVIDPKKLRFLYNAVCVCNTVRLDTLDAFTRLVKQLEVYGADLLKPLKPGGQVRRHFHGKRGSGKDDLAMAFQLCLVANQLFFTQPRKYGITPALAY